MVRFLNGLKPSIMEKVDIQHYWMFEDVCKLAIKVEKYSKNKEVYGSSYTKLTVPPKRYSSPNLNNTPRGDGNRDKGKSVIKQFPKQLNGKRCFRCQGYGHFQDDYPNRRALILKEIQEIDQSTLEAMEKKEEEKQRKRTS